MTTETTPELLAVGDEIIAARDGKVYEVVDREVAEGNAVLWHLRREGSEKVHPVAAERLPPKIQLVSTLAERQANARALLQVRLGAEVVAERQNGKKDGPWVVPTAFPDVGGLYAHLYLFHFVKEDPKDATAYPDGDLSDLIAEHTRLHEAGRIAEAHEHISTFYRDMEVAT